jgi:hypothetical protein
MATQKQIDANRRNALRSTGPRTDEGKSKTRLNATRDGITGQVITLSEDDRPVFEKLKSEMIAGLAPKTVMELSLANSIAWDTWRLNHLRAVEMNMYALGADDPASQTDSANPQIRTAMSAALTFASEGHKFALMSIYGQRMNRTLHKNLETLRSLQAERKANYKEDREEEILLARYSENNGLPYHAPQAPTANGSVFSKHEILTAANRLTTLKVAHLDVWHAPLKVQFAGAGASGVSAPTETVTTTSPSNLSTMPSGGAKPAFLSR